MGQYPHLQSFLVNGQAECYEGITIDYDASAGDGSTLSIYHNDVYMETINLIAYSKNEQTLHRLMRIKKFRPKDRKGRRLALDTAKRKQDEDKRKRELRQEYYRKQQQHVEFFTQDVIAQYPCRYCPLGDVPSPFFTNNQHPMCMHGGYRNHYLTTNYNNLFQDDYFYMKTLQHLRPPRKDERISSLTEPGINAQVDPQQVVEKRLRDIQRKRIEATALGIEQKKRARRQREERKRKRSKQEEQAEADGTGAVDNGEEKGNDEDDTVVDQNDKEKLAVQAETQSQPPDNEL